jgi:hypothetical protein
MLLVPGRLLASGRDEELPFWAASVELVRERHAAAADAFCLAVGASVRPYYAGRATRDACDRALQAARRAFDAARDEIEANLCRCGETPHSAALLLGMYYLLPPARLATIELQPARSAEVIALSAYRNTR